LRNDIDLEYFHRLLEEKYGDLIARQDDQKGAAGIVELDQTRVGRLSRMDALQQQAMARASARRSTTELQRIDAALVRLRTGEYGSCLNCGQDIGIKRLEVDPGVLNCMTCARLVESR